MKVQFIVVGWHMNQSSLIDGLYELKETNDNINVFWTCHKEPTKEIKEKFEYKLFFNGGEECGAYDQAIEYLNLEDDTLCYFLHDDIIIKDWEFMNQCFELLNQGYKVIGNCMDYTTEFDPYTITKLGITEQFDGAYFKDYVKEENQHLFDKEPMLMSKVRPSFICIFYRDIKAIGGFEPRKEAYIPPLTEKDEWSPDGGPHYRGSKGLGSFGNLFPALVCYKMNKILGSHTITHMSDTHLDSSFIYECGRGIIADEHPIT